MKGIEGEGLPTACASCGEKVLPPDSHCARCENKKYTGIGGWLYLPAMTLVLSVISGGVGFFGVAAFVLHTEAEVSALVIFELVCMTALLILVIYTTVLFFKKKRQLPKFYTAFILGTMFYYVMDSWLGATFYDVGLSSDDIKAFVSCAGQILIWIPYFRVSKRVKLTFVN
ncbi:MAG: DUF2569 domain-containing protein [Citrobacter sp.]|uniref:DUF2569 domain-containing protein n=1 Tax=Citrobacter sp. TaxID=1896336 RepID=UPI002FCBD4FF